MSILVLYIYLTQTITTLCLGGNCIGDTGIQHLTSALKVNTVRGLLCMPTTHLLSSFHIDTHNATFWKQQNWCRRSKIFGKCVASEYREKISVHCDCSQIVFPFHTDTSFGRSWMEPNRLRRSTIFSRCTTKEFSETISKYLLCLFAKFVPHRHS